jgi:hypothetical protein
MNRTLGLILFITVWTSQAALGSMVWHYDSGNNVLWATNCFWQGGELFSVQASAEQCPSHCANSQATHARECVAFTWTSQDGGTCWMKFHNLDTDTPLKSGDASTLCGYRPYIGELTFLITNFLLQI